MSLLTLLFSNPHHIHVCEKDISKVTNLIVQHGGNVFCIDKMLSKSNTYCVYFEATNKQYQLIMIEILALNNSLK